VLVLMSLGVMPAPYAPDYVPFVYILAAAGALLSPLSLMHRHGTSTILPRV
jgi:hypothetical protein